MKRFGPTEKQIEFVEKICKELGIDDFPMSSKEFTKWHYSQFIKAHIDEYKANEVDNIHDEEWCYEYCNNDVWCEHY